MRNTKVLSLLALAALASAASGIYQTSQKTTSSTGTRRYPKVQRMVKSPIDEINQWNSEVDARKAAKKGRK